MAGDVRKPAQAFAKRAPRFIGVNYKRQTLAQVLTLTYSHLSRFIQ